MSGADLEGAALACRHWGAGEPVVLLHSSTGAGVQWGALGEALSRDFLVLAPDLYGYGDSPAWPGHRAIRLADEAAAVERLARASGGPIHLVGHSYGGAVALKAAQRGKIALRSLTLIEPVSFHILCNSDPWGARHLDQISDIADYVQSILATGDREGAMHCFVDFWNGPGAWRALPPRQRRKIMDAAPKVPLDFWAAMSDTATLEDYSTLEVPTLVLCGDRSPSPTRRIASLLDIALPDCRLSVVPGAGHMLPLTHPEPVNRTVAAHLSRFQPINRRAA